MSEERLDGVRAKSLLLARYDERQWRRMVVLGHSRRGQQGSVMTGGRAAHFSTRSLYFLLRRVQSLLGVVSLGISLLNHDPRPDVICQED
jgi:hypothetical protein